MQQRRFFLAAAIASGLALSGLLTSPVRAQTALDEVMTKKPIKIAIPTDFPPYGFVGTDLKPQGLDIDMANYIGEQARREGRTGAGDQRQPHPLPADARRPTW